MKINEELVKGCRQYLNELERRKGIIEQQRQAETLKWAKREKLRKMLYEDSDEMVTIIV